MPDSLRIAQLGILGWKGGNVAVTHASNKQAWIGRSGVDASSNVLSVTSPPGLPSLDTDEYNGLYRLTLHQ